MEKPLTPATTANHVAAARAHRVRRVGFACMECGHKFKTTKAAERAAYGDKGCPKCGGSDIDLAK